MVALLFEPLNRFNDVGDNLQANGLDGGVPVAYNKAKQGSHRRPGAAPRKRNER
jgi:hypothetical protein